MIILIADDDPALRRIIMTHLRRGGHDVLEAGDGQSAWEQMQSEGIRMVITDWMMPTVDGLELIRRVRAADRSNYTYMILLTAKGGKDDVVTGLEAGADDYLTKPFHPGELRARVAIGERILNLEARLSESRQQMEVLAMHDGLTGLLNRRAIQSHAEAELNRSYRDGTPLGLALIDLDHFKSINDQYGHLVGDQALRLVAEVLTQSKRAYDWAGRWGGEEFLLVLPGAHLQEANAIAERIRMNIGLAYLPLADGTALHVRASVGVTTLSVGPESVGPESRVVLDALLKQADDALYRAKRAGRDQVHAFQA